MRIHLASLVAGLVFALPASAQQDPCVVLGFATSYGSQNGNNGCVGPLGQHPSSGPTSFTNAEDLQLRLAAQTVSELRTLIAEIKGLRSELAAYSAGLNQAKAKFDAATITVANNQENWRKEALSKTLAEITEIPARLGGDKGLRDALLATLKEELPKDPAFLQALLQTSKK